MKSNGPPRRQFLGLFGSTVSVGFTGSVKARSFTQSSGISDNKRDKTLESASPTWVRRFGTKGDDFIQSVSETPDGGFIFVGTSDERAWVSKVNPNGMSAWNRTFERGTEANDVVATEDGSVVFGGRIESDGETGDDVLLGWLTADGSIRRVERMSTDGEQHLRALIRSHGEGFVYAGHTERGSDRNILAVQVDAEARRQWARTVTHTGNDWANDVIRTEDGGYLVAGRWYDGGTHDAVLIKLTADGSVEWEQTYGGGRSNGAASVISTSDGGYRFVGKTGRGGGIDGWMVSVGPEGSHLGTRYYDGLGATATAEDVVELSDDGYVFYGATAEDETEDLWMGKTGQDGALEWERTWDAGGDDYALSFLRTSDGGYLLTGNTDRTGDGDVLLLKYPSLPVPNEGSSVAELLTPTPTATSPPTPTRTPTPSPPPKKTSSEKEVNATSSNRTPTDTQINTITDVDTPGMGIVAAISSLAGLILHQWNNSAE